jgi:serine/threonine protein phosphatase 1
MSRHIIIGDIHGCFTELLELLERVHCTDDDIVVSVGDLVDRGPDSPRVLAWFRERVARGRAIVLMGNHERKHVREVFSYSQEITRLQFGEGYEDAVAWMRGLPYSYETDDFIVVHAAMMPDVPLAEQREDVLAGTTSGERALEARSDRWHAL